jgi:sugar lactone lactonase YvrE
VRDTVGTAPFPSGPVAAAAGAVVDPAPAWSRPPTRAGKPENLAFSRDGALLAVVDADAGRILVHARRGAGLDYGEEPVWTLEGPDSGLDYPHDVDLAPDGRWLVVASRRGRRLTGYRRLAGPVARFSSRPSWILEGRKSALGYCDGVEAAPAGGALLAAVSLAEHRVTFFRPRLLLDGWRRRPWHVLQGEAHGLAHPDGLAFSADGLLLAVTNHGAGNVVVYARPRNGRFGDAPVAVVGGRPRYRCPHSAAFSPDGHWLAIADAGSRSVTLHRREPDEGGLPRWSREPLAEVDAVPDGADVCDQEGGPKGVAFGPGCLAFCSREAGIRLHRLL